MSALHHRLPNSRIARVHIYAFHRSSLSELRSKWNIPKGERRARDFLAAYIYAKRPRSTWLDTHLYTISNTALNHVVNRSLGSSLIHRKQSIENVVLCVWMHPLHPLSLWQHVKCIKVPLLIALGHRVGCAFGELTTLAYRNERIAPEEEEDNRSMQI